MYSTAQKIKDYLDQSHITYWTNDSGPDRATGHETALPKYAVDGVVYSLLVKIAGKPAVVAVSSEEEFDVEDMRAFLNTDDVEVVSDAEYCRLFPDCEATAIPALGSVFGIPVYCSRQVMQKKKICFNSGTHDEIIQLATGDFIGLVHPVVGNFTHSAAANVRAAYYW